MSPSVGHTFRFPLCLCLWEHGMSHIFWKVWPKAFRFCLWSVFCKVYFSKVYCLELGESVAVPFFHHTGCSLTLIAKPGHIQLINRSNWLFHIFVGCFYFFRGHIPKFPFFSRCHITFCIWTDDDCTDLVRSIRTNWPLCMGPMMIVLYIRLV